MPAFRNDYRLLLIHGLLHHHKWLTAVQVSGSMHPDSGFLIAVQNDAVACLYAKNLLGMHAVQVPHQDAFPPSCRRLVPREWFSTAGCRVR